MKNVIYHGGGGKRKSFSSSGAGTDKFVKVRDTDIKSSYLNDKLDIGTGLQGLIQNPGGDEVLQINNIAPVDWKVKARASDSFPNYLDGKIQAGTGISISYINPNADEKMVISNSATGSRYYTLSYGTGLALGVDVHVPASQGGPDNYHTWGIGHYILNNSRILRWSILVPKYVSYNSGHYTRFQLKRITANGASTSDITSASGTNLRNFDFTFPNTGGSYRYFIGRGENNLNIDINAGEMLFIVICSHTVNAALGATIWVQMEEL